MIDEDAHVWAFDRTRDIAWSLALLLTALRLSEAARDKAKEAEQRLFDAMDRADRLGGADRVLLSLQRRERARLAAALAYLDRTSDLLESACRMHAKVRGL